MANSVLISLLVLLSAMYIVAAQQKISNITQGSSLTPTGKSSWLSPSGLFAFGFYPQGENFRVGIFLAGFPSKTVVWTANRDDPPVSDNVTLSLTQGTLILQPNSQNSNTNIVSIAQSIVSASMLDSGNFVLYDSNREIIWQSFNDPTDTILSGQSLLNGRQLISSVSPFDNSKGIFRLEMQSDSNLVQHPIDASGPEHAYWDSRTNGMGVNVTLTLYSDGNLRLINKSGNILKTLTDSANGLSEKLRLYLMRIDSDGIFRVYSYSLENRGNSSLVVMESSHDKCDPKGLCGLNGYCILYDDQVKCLCLPGFDEVSPGNWTAGCERIYNAVGCKNEQMIEYEMKPLSQTQWENDPYSVVKIINAEDCKNACLEDCNCEAAFFKDAECRKQRLPLRYGRRLLTESNIAYIKWVSPTPENKAPTGHKSEKTKQHPVSILIIGVSLVVLAFMVFVISGYIAYKTRARAYTNISANGNFQLMEDIAPRSYTYAELEKVTNCFSDEIGRGASGKVFKGTLEYDNKVVAVKRLENMLAEGEKEFQNEMKVIGRTHHRNLVRLLGYSLDGPKMLLVYEYMVNGSLADILFDPNLRPRWDERIRIALDIARGILYLHEECETQIIHCDIKPQNTLMDEYRSAKISDFGLAKLLKADQTATYTGIRGTRGYVAPEWHRKMAVTAKVDVYSFGIMLLEIICCRKCVDNDLSEEEAILEEWVYQCFANNELSKLVIDEETDKPRFERMVRVGLWCILDEPSLRPSMKKVLLMLEGTVDIPTPPSLSSYLTTI